MFRACGSSPTAGAALNSIFFSQLKKGCPGRVLLSLPKAAMSHDRPEHWKRRSPTHGTSSRGQFFLPEERAALVSMQLFDAEQFSCHW